MGAVCPLTLEAKSAVVSEALGKAKVVRYRVTAGGAASAAFM
jgi:hypothetical protein